MQSMSRQTAWPVLAVLLSALLLAAAPAGANMAANAGFENWSGGPSSPPDDWSLIGSSFDATQSSDPVHGGSYSVALTYTDTSTVHLEQIVPGITVGGEYTFGGWAYDNDPQGRARLTLRWEDSGGGYIENFYSDYTADQAAWSYLEVTATAPSGAAQAALRISCYDVNPFTEATLYADDVSFNGAGTPTETPTPTPTPSGPTFTPTNTPTPSPSPTATLTPTQGPTSTPTWEPTYSPTPESSAPPTPTPSPTPPVTTLGVTIEIPNEMVHPGDTFYWISHLRNPHVTMTDIPVFNVMEVLGQFWFWPSWAYYNPPGSESLDYEIMDVPAGSTPIMVIDQFVWPDTGSSSLSGIRLYGAMLEQDLSDIMGEMGFQEWGYGPR